jgi:hypothetical protein
LTLSVFESESDQKYKNNYDIGDIHSYPIRFHPYVCTTSSIMVTQSLMLTAMAHDIKMCCLSAITYPM